MEKEQTDTLGRFWSNDKDFVQTRYLDSSFL